MNASTPRPPRSFWIISVIALMWNFMGLMAFFGQTFMSEKTLSSYPEEQQALYMNVPTWLSIVYAIATVAGTLGCVGLLIKKSWAKLFFFISLIAVLIQMGYNLFMTNAAEVLGPIATVMSIVLIFVSVFLYFYAKWSQEKGWIS